MRTQLAMTGALLAGLFVLPVGALAADPVLPWIADDHTRAVTEARARKLPIFVESWAPW